MPNSAPTSRLAVAVFALCLSGMAAALRAQPIPIPVTTLADSGVGSFRAAIEEANRQAANAGPTRRIEVTFAAGLAGGTVNVQGVFPMLFADYTTIQVAGAQPAPVVLSMPFSFVAAGRDMVLRDLVFRRPVNDPGSGDNVILVACRGFRMERCTLENPPVAGLFLVGCPDGVLDRCVVRDVGTGRRGAGVLGQDGSDRLLVTNCTFEGLLGHSLVLATVVGCRVQDCTFRNVAGAVMLTENCRDTVIGPNNLVDAATWIGVTADLVGPLSPGVAGSPGLRIHQNTFRNGATSAILVRNRSKHVIVEDNLVEGNGRTNGLVQVMLQDSEEVVVRNNRIRLGQGPGLAVLGGRDVQVHSGNVIEGNRGDGVIVADGAREVWIGPRDPSGAVVGNVVRNNSGLAARFTGAVDCHLTGNTAVAGGRTVVQGNVGPIVLGSGSTGCSIGPGLDVTGGTPSAIELTPGCSDIRIVDVIASGYRDRGLYAASATGVRVSDCRFQGSGTDQHGVRMFDSIGVEVFSTECRGHGMGGFAFNGCHDVLVGPGSRAVRNGETGITFQRGAFPATPRAVVQSAVAINQSGVGAGIAFQDVDGLVLHATVAGNHRGLLIQGSSDVSVINSLLWANRDRDRLQTAPAIGRVRFTTFSSSQGSWQDGPGIGSTDPRFASLAQDDVRLQPSSSAIDSGALFAADLPAADGEAEQRVRGGGVDRGAHEKITSQQTSLVLIGPILRERDVDLFELDLDAGAAGANKERLLLIGASGNAPAFPLLGGALLPLWPDDLTTAWFQSPMAIGRLDGQGRERFQLRLPLPVMAVLPEELTFAFTLFPEMNWVSNPVAVRLW